MIGDVLHFTCSVCNKPSVSYGDRKPVYCSRACMTADYRERFSGENNPAWRGGKWKYKGPGWQTISAAVLAESDACAYCPTDPVLVHHLIPQRFWIDLDASNVRTNLVPCCGPCHGGRPEHYWRQVPADLFVAELHVREGTRRTRPDIRPKPLCEVCGAPCRLHTSRYCSRSCSNTARWAAGVYDGAKLALNLPR